MLDAHERSTVHSLTMVINDRAHNSARAHSGAAHSGLRERNKAKKLERIVRAGRALFVQKGFDATTTRAIASKAGVAAATFFLYFREKRDLLFHLFKDEVSGVQEEAFASSPSDAPLVDQLTHVFGRFYTYYGQDPRLSRVFIKELLFLEPSERDDQIALTLRFAVRLAELVTAAKNRGEVRDSVESMEVAAHAFSLYLFGLICWLNGAIQTPEMMQSQLKSQLGLLIRGICPEPARRNTAPVVRRKRRREVRR